MTDRELDVLIATHLFGLTIAGTGECSFYDGCPFVSGPVGEVPDEPHPVFVRNPEDKHYHVSEQPLRIAEELERWSTSDNHTLQADAKNIAERHFGLGNYIGEWHGLHACEPLEFYSSSIGAALGLVIPAMRDRRGFKDFDLSQRNGTWWATFYRPSEEFEGSPTDSPARAVVFATLKALGVEA